MKKLLMLSAAALVLGAPFAFAEDTPMEESSHERPHRGDMMEKIDTDKDGAISKNEFISFHEERFKEIDKNADGKITQDEREASKAEWRKKIKDLREKRRAKQGENAPDEAPAEETPAEKPAE